MADDMSRRDGVVIVYIPLDAQGKVSSLGDRRVCQRHSLGWLKIGREQKLEWGPITNPGPTLRCRDVNAHAYATVCGPDDLLNSVINDIIGCCIVGTAAAGLAAIIAGPAAALPTFKAAFNDCMKAKIGDKIAQISVTLSVETSTTDWGPC